MKKLILLIIILVLGAGAYFLLNKPERIDTTELGYNPQDVNYRADPSNATFDIDGESITLSSGKNEAESRETTILKDKLAYGDINGDGKTDAVFLLSQYGGGTGVFIYVAGYVSSPINYKGSSAYFLGDRIAPQSISINNGLITVNYLDRAPSEPFAAEPTISTSKQLIYSNGKFQER